MAGSYLLPVPEVGARIVHVVSDRGPFWALPLGPPLGPGGALRGSGLAGPWALVGPRGDRALRSPGP